jgi:hypothetical protein
MSYDDNYDSTEYGSENDTNLVKQLRSKIDELSKENKTLRTEYTELKGVTRKQTLSAVLEARGFAPKIAAFIPEDLDPTEDSIDAWLAEYGDVFGGAKQPPQDGEAVPQQATVVADAAQAEAIRRMSAAEAAAQPSANISGDIIAQIESAGSMEELMTLLRTA